VPPVLCLSLGPCLPYSTLYLVSELRCLPLGLASNLYKIKSVSWFYMSLFYKWVLNVIKIVLSSLEKSIWVLLNLSSQTFHWFMLSWFLTLTFILRTNSCSIFKRFYFCFQYFIECSLLIFYIFYIHIHWWYLLIISLRTVLIWIMCHRMSYVASCIYLCSTSVVCEKNSVH
jgi:hypothetical protein